MSDIHPRIDPPLGAPSGYIGYTDTTFIYYDWDYTRGEYVITATISHPVQLGFDFDLATLPAG